MGPSMKKPCFHFKEKNKTEEIRGARWEEEMGPLEDKTVEKQELKARMMEIDLYEQRQGLKA